MAITHTRTWQFQLNQVVDVSTSTVTNPAVNDRSLMIGLVGSMLGRGSWVDKNNGASASAGNWTVTSSCDGAGGATFGNNDGINYWDVAGVLTASKLVWANPASNHSWIVLQQTGVSAKFEVLIDLRVGGASTQATIIVSNAGFGVANGGTNGTATAAPTAVAGSFQSLITVTDWGGGGILGSMWHAQKTTNGSAFRFFIMRSNACVGFYQFEIPDPVVAGWTAPWIAQAIGHSAATEQVQMTQLNGTNTYSRTAGGTIFASSYTQPASQTDTNMITFGGSGFGGAPLEIDDTDPIHPIALYSATVNARNVNGKIVDLYWANQPGITFLPLAGQTLPAGGPIQWARVGTLWVPWASGNIPRMQL
jgi:hypothetical protein